MPIFRTLNHDFFKKWSPQMVYLLGYIAADGAVTIGKRGNCYLEVQSIDKELPLMLKRAMGAGHKVAVVNRSRTRHLIYRLQIGSKEMVKDLAEVGIFPKKARRLILPVIPKQYFADFVRGYFDGDGNVNFTLVKRYDRLSYNKHLHTVFTSCSKKMINALFIRLKEEIKMMGGSKHFAGGAFRLLYAGHDSTKLFHFMYRSRRSLFLKRKYRYFKKAIQQFRKNYGPVV